MDRRHDYKAVLGYIIDFKKQNDGLSPSIREIMDACAITSSSLCLYILRTLDDDGFIRLVGKKGTARSIQVVGGQWTVSS